MSKVASKMIGSSLKELPQYMLAYQKILRSVSICEQSSAKMRNKLQASGFEESAICLAMEKAIRAGILSDKRYSEYLIRSALCSGKGLSFVEREIEELGIDINELESYQEYLEEGTESQVKSALEILEKHPPRAKNKRDAALRKLISKGFSSEIAFEAISEWSDNFDTV